MEKNAIFITGDNEKITHMFTAEHGLYPGVVQPDGHGVEFKVKQGVLSLFTVVDDCQENIIEVENCISKNLKQLNQGFDGYTGKIAYFYDDVTGSEPVKYILGPPNNLGNVLKNMDNTGILILIQSQAPVQDQDGSSVNSISEQIQPESVSVQTPIAIPMNESDEIKMVFATAIQIAEPISNLSPNATVLRTSTLGDDASTTFRAS